MTDPATAWLVFALGLLFTLAVLALAIGHGDDE